MCSTDTMSTSSVHEAVVLDGQYKQSMQFFLAHNDLTTNIAQIQELESLKIMAHIFITLHYHTLPINNCKFQIVLAISKN